MESSILNDIKKMLGLPPDYTPFDQEIIIFINTVLATIHQLGHGDSAYAITSAEDTWSDFLGEDSANLELVKTYVFLKVRLLFDPPASSSILQAFTELAKEYEWRVYMEVDKKLQFDELDEE